MSEPVKFGPCPKCHHDDLHTRYHEGGRHGCSTGRHCDLPPASCKYTECNKRAEHFYCRCNTCGYSWTETLP